MELTEHVYITSGENSGVIKKMSSEEAREIKAQGRGHVMDMSEYNSYEERATTALHAYKSLEKRLKNSDDPHDGTPEIKEYVLQEASDQLAQEIATIDAEWSARQSEMVEQAKQAAATHTTYVSASDNTLAPQFANRWALQLASTKSTDGQKQVIAEMTDEIARLTDGQRIALQPHLLTLSGVVKQGVDLTGLYTAASDLQSPRATAYKAAAAMPYRPSTAYHQMMIVRELTKKRRGSM